jgi:hypothetical protein
MQALHESFVEAAEIMQDCAKYGMIRSLINAGKQNRFFVWYKVVK